VRVTVVVHSRDVQPRGAGTDGRGGRGGGGSDERVPCGTDGRLEIGDQHPLQGAPGRGPDEGGDAAEAYEEDARFAVAVAGTGAPLRVAGRAGATRGWPGSGAGEVCRLHCGSSGGAHRRRVWSGNRCGEEKVGDMIVFYRLHTGRVLCGMPQAKWPFKGIDRNKG
jgi:hypothetical protein